MTSGDVVRERTSAKAVAVLGSSGGNLRSHGGDDPVRLLRDVRRQLDAAGFALAEVQFVATMANLYLPGLSADIIDTGVVTGEQTSPDEAGLWLGSFRD